MGARLGNGRGGEDERDLTHEINVTSFIDVILVLLIIFMVAAPSRPSTSPSICLSRPRPPATA